MIFDPDNPDDLDFSHLDTVDGKIVDITTPTIEQTEDGEHRFYFDGGERSSVHDNWHTDPDTGQIYADESSKDFYDEFGSNDLPF